MNQTFSIDDMGKVINRLPPFPAVVREALAALNGKSPSLPALAHIIERDPIIAGRLLRIANSSFYGMRGRVASVRDACRIVGLDALRNMLNAFGAIAQLSATKTEIIDHRRIWSHGAASGAVARTLCSLTGRDAETGFTAGLFHNLGCFVMELLDGERYGALWQATCGVSQALLVEEERVYGLNHRQASALLMASWGLPKAICDAVAFSAQPKGEVPANLDDVVHISCLLAEIIDTPSKFDALCADISPVQLVRLGVTAADMSGWRDTFAEAATESRTLFAAD